MLGLQQLVPEAGEGGGLQQVLQGGDGLVLGPHQDLQHVHLTDEAEEGEGPKRGSW